MRLYLTKHRISIWTSLATGMTGIEVRRCNDSTELSEGTRRKAQRMRKGSLVTALSKRCLRNTYGFNLVWQVFLRVQY